MAEIRERDICIICKNEIKADELKDSKRVVDDLVIRTIRKIKSTINMASNNRLYVCKKDLEEHAKRRKSFERSIVLTLLFALFIFIGLSLIPFITSGTIRLESIFLGLIIAILLIVMCGFLKYTPEIRCKI